MNRTSGRCDINLMPFSPKRHASQEGVSISIPMDSRVSCWTLSEEGMAMVDIEHIKHVKIIVAARILLIDDSIDLLKKERDRNR
jgi:hypothetical protein